MPLIWHIFRKDVRTLRWNLAIFALCSLLLGVGTGLGTRYEAWHTATGAFPLFGIALSVGAAVGGLQLTMLAIQEDPVPGHTQDWLTRPLGWWRLLAAKLLFVTLCVAPLPLLVDLAALTGAGLNPAAYGTELACRYALFLCALFLPAAALSALTRTPPLALGAALLLGLLFLFSGLVPPVAARFHFGDPRTPQLAWLVYGLTAALALALLVFQYATRRTLAARLLTPIAFLLILFVSAKADRYSAGLDGNSPALPDGLSVRIAAGSFVHGPDSPDRQPLSNDSGELMLPLELTGVDPATEVLEGAAPVVDVYPVKTRPDAIPTNEPAFRLQASLVPVGHRAMLVAYLPEGFQSALPDGLLRVEARLRLKTCRPGHSITLSPGNDRAWLPDVGFFSVTWTGGAQICRYSTLYRLRHMLRVEFQTATPTAVVPTRSVPVYADDSALPVDLGLVPFSQRLTAKSTGGASSKPLDGLEQIQITRFDEVRTGLVTLRTPSVPVRVYVRRIPAGRRPQ